MACQKCNSERVAEIGGKCSDRFHAYIGDRETSGYVDHDLGIGGGNYIEFNLCLDCGQVQGEFPLPPTFLETGKNPDDDEDDYDDDEGFCGLYFK